jgi:hypothetical protein
MLHLNILKRKRGRNEEARKLKQRKEENKKNVLKMAVKYWYSSSLAVQDSTLP